MHVHVHAIGVQLQLHSMWKLSGVPLLAHHVPTFGDQGCPEANLHGLQRHEHTAEASPTPQVYQNLQQRC